MEKKMNIKYAGDIGKELEIVDSLSKLTLESEATLTHTADCGTFLTIYCC